jgi:hypothetical protein
MNSAQNGNRDLLAKPEQSPKKPYRAPVVHFYGTIRAITASISMAGSAMDGGSNSIKT